MTLLCGLSTSVAFADQTGSGVTEVTVVQPVSAVPSDSGDGSSSVGSSNGTGSFVNPTAGNLTRSVSVGGDGVSPVSAASREKLSKTGDLAISSSLLAFAAFLGLVFVVAGSNLRGRKGDL